MQNLPLQTTYFKLSFKNCSFSSNKGVVGGFKNNFQKLSENQQENFTLWVLFNETAFILKLVQSG